MKVTILQRDIVWADPAENIRRAQDAINRNPGTDLFVLPEMWASGFNTKPDDFDSSAANMPLSWMKEVAASNDCAICGSIAVKSSDKLLNRLFFVTPDGNCVSYDKRHLFTFGGEQNSFSAGSERVIVKFRGFRFLLQVCYDIRFPVWSRNHADYDAAIYVASWPAPRIDAWDTLLKARAIENQCFVIGVNRVGTDPHCSYPGHSIIYNAYGKVLARCPDDSESEASALIDIDSLGAFRRKFPVLDDADVFTIL